MPHMIAEDLYNVALRAFVSCEYCKYVISIVFYAIFGPRSKLVRPVLDTTCLAKLVSCK